MSTFLDFTYRSVKTAARRYFEPLRWVAGLFRRDEKVQYVTTKNVLGEADLSPSELSWGLKGIGFFAIGAYMLHKKISGASRNLESHNTGTPYSDLPEDHDMSAKELRNRDAMKRLYPTVEAVAVAFGVDLS